VQLAESVIVGMRYDAMAQLLDSTPVLLSTHAVCCLSAAASADTFLVVWRDRVDGVRMATERLAGRRITASGTMVDSDVRDYAYSADGHWTKHVAVASDGKDFLAVWCDERADPDYVASLRGRRFDKQGQFLDAEPFTITDHHLNPVRPVLSYGAGRYLVCWSQVRGVGEDTVSTFATRISRAGELMDTVPICVPHTFGVLGMTFVRESMFVVLAKPDPNNVAPYVIRLMADGRVLDSVPQKLGIRQDPDFVYISGSISSIGDTLVMACGMFGHGAIWVGVGLYDGELNQLDSIYWRPPPGADWAHGTTVACGGGRILVASESDPSLWPDFYLLDSAGNVLNDSLPLPPSGLQNHYYSTVWDGTNFQCASTPGPRYTSVVGCRFTPAGVRLDSPPIGLVTFDSTPTSGSCALATDSSGYVGLVFFASEPETYMSTRVRAAVFPRLTGGVEEAHGIQPPRYFCQTVVGRVLNLPRGGQAMAYQLMDVSGRSVAILAPGQNDISHLAPGVYFVREEGRGARGVGRSRKVVVTR
jgi:hypothetical protein